MKENESALFSKYIIDGVQCDATPAELLSECMSFVEDDSHDDEVFEDIIDETTDRPIKPFAYDQEKISEYIETVSSYEGDRPFRMLYPETFTKQRIAAALLERLWNKGHYRLGNLSLWVEWDWNSRPLGNMAAFYESARATSEYIYDLGCRLEAYDYDGYDRESRVRFAAWLPASQESSENHEDAADNGILFKSPYESRHPWIDEERKCPDKLLCDSDSEILYIPFDTSSFKLGASLFAELLGSNGDAAPRMQDPDYFIDCYEVVRELVEDGMVLSGHSVGDGGLAYALSRMSDNCGIRLNIQGIASSYMEDDPVKILFSEIPGVIMQVSKSNLDYIDSQFILQDVAYYRIGTASTEFKGIRICSRTEAAVADILASLLEQASEGED